MKFCPALKRSARMSELEKIRRELATVRAELESAKLQIQGRWKVDLVPDELEKRIYKKILKIVISMIENIKFSPSPLVK